MRAIFDESLSAIERAEALVKEMTLAEKLGQLMDKAPAIERLGVEEFGWWNECLHGMARNGTATVFPQAIALAATFDVSLMHQVAEVISDEVRARYNAMRAMGACGIYKGLTVCAPNINIFRDPRWGRGQETYGEDPYLTAEMAVAYVKGMQGEDPEHHKLDCEIKHFAVHSGPEALRHEIDVQIDEKQLYETYLYAFEECIRRANVASIMAAYNRINHMPCAGSKFLLDDILRKRLGFDGYVVSDSGAIDDFHLHHCVTSSPVESAALAFNSGCDLNIGSSYRYLPEAVEKGLVKEADIDAALIRLFAARVRLGMFDQTGNLPYDSLQDDIINNESAQALARKAARECVVLLKNENALLPLRKSAKIAVIGPNADSREVLLGNYNGTPAQYSTLLEGIRNHCKDRNQVLYEEGCDLYKPLDRRCGWDIIPAAVRAAERSDFVILCLGLSPQIEGEAGDATKPDRDSLCLPGRQPELVRAIAETGKPIVLVLTGGSAISIPEEEKLAGAVVHCWYPGQDGGNALADVLFGDYSPSGRMPVTTVCSENDLPPFDSYDMEGRTYRFIRKEPLYPFGFGLGYIPFRFANLKVPEQISVGELVRVEVDVENCGERDGETVAQLYLIDEDSKMKTPIRQLAGFTRIFVASKQKVSVCFILKPGQFSVIDMEGKRQFEEGWFTVEVGSVQGDVVSERLSGEKVLRNRIYLNCNMKSAD